MSTREQFQWLRTRGPAILLIVILLAAGLAQAAWTTVRQVKGASRTLAEVEGKSRSYWELSKDGSMTVTVNGPATLRIVTRSPWRTKFKGDSWQLHWMMDGQDGGVFTHPVTKSRSARQHPPKGSKIAADPTKWARLSTSFTDEIEIPLGTHQVQFKIDKSPDTSLLLRLQRKLNHPIPRDGNIDLLPRNHADTRDIVVKDSKATYQVLKSGGELALEVTGPTFVKVISRLDWNTTMAGRQKYQLKVFEDGNLKNTWVLHGRRSENAGYSNKPNSTPARGEILYIQVPAGKHQYKVKFQDSGREVNLRFLLPRESLRNSGK